MLKFIFFQNLGRYSPLKAPKLPKIHISRTAGRRNLVDPQNDHKNGFTMVDLRYVYPSDDRKCLKHASPGLI